MRALRLIEARRLEIVEVPEPAPAPGEVVLRVAATGICGSDLTCYKWGIFAGSILGHELAGFVAASDSPEWEPGTPVAVDPKIPCGVCSDCRGGAEHRCTEALTLGIGAKRDGGFAERVAVPGALLHRLPAGVRPEDACLIEPLSVALHGLARAGDVKDAATVVVGLGPIGLLTVAALHSSGARRIVGVDPVEARRKLAASLGAGETIAPGAEAREAAAGAELAVEASGRAEVVQECSDLVAPGGRVLLLGVPMKEATVVPLAWITRELTLIGSIASTAEEFAAAAGLLARRPEIASIITSRVGLESLPAAFEDLLSPSTEGKVVFTPSI